jgi:leucyl aminopeptidase
MDVTIRSSLAHERRAGMAAWFLFEGERPLTGAAARFDRASGGALTRLLASNDFTGRWLDSALLYPARGSRATRVLVVGLGPRDQLSPPRWLQAAAAAARRARALRVRTLALALPESLATPEWARAAAEGAVLGHHAFTAYRSEKLPPLRSVECLVADPRLARTLAAAMARGARCAEGTCLARDLAATPGQDLVPEQLAARARETAEASGATARVLRVAQLERLGLGCLLAVGRGSPNPPCLVALDHPPAQAPARRARAATIVLVGKGITFDTGGISLKPREDMARMKYDMSGAAAVIGAFSALPSLELPFRVVGLLACAENMPDGRSVKPGDVVRAMDGTTIEITNTDAEGRLVLADALCYARGFRPSVVVDLATLTGAARIALGAHAAGLFTADDALAAELLDAGTATGERLWRMPLWDEYAQELRSDTADVVNSATREGGAAIAAAFLRRFARGLAWAHLDIAPTGWAAAERPHEPRGPTGFGVRLLLEWLSARAAAANRNAPSTPPSGPASHPRSRARRGRRRVPSASA